MIIKKLTITITKMILITRISLHCALASCGAVYGNRSCVWVCDFFVCLFLCLWVCYHDNSKLRSSILTKLGPYSVCAICSWLNFGRPAPAARGSVAGRNFWLRLTTASAQCLRLLRSLFIFILLTTMLSDRGRTICPRPATKSGLVIDSSKPRPYWLGATRRRPSPARPDVRNIQTSSDVRQTSDSIIALCRWWLFNTAFAVIVNIVPSWVAYILISSANSLHAQLPICHH